MRLLPTEEDFPLSAPSRLAEPILTIICITSILLPAGLLRLSAGVIIFAVYFYVQFWTASKTFEGFGIGNSCIILVFRWLDLVAIHCPERDFWKIEDRPKNKQEARQEEKSAQYAFCDILIKLKWFASLWIASRGIGWNIQNDKTPLPVSKNFPRSLWLRKSIVRAFQMYFACDVTCALLAHLSIRKDFFTISIYRQISLAWLKAFQAYYSSELLYSLCGIAFVFFEFSRPCEWPPFTGSFRRDAYTIRRMWGRVWHQTRRRASADGGRIVKELFGFKKGTFMSRYSQLWVGFLVSAVGHHAGAIVGCFEDKGFYQATFFMMQPAAIMFEDYAMYLGRKFGIKESIHIRRFGFLWVVCWFSFSIRFYVAYEPYSWTEGNLFPSLMNMIIGEKTRVGSMMNLHRGRQ